MNYIKKSIVIYLLMLLIIGCSSEYIKVSSEKNIASAPDIILNYIDNQFAIVWYETRNKRTDIYFARYDSDGNKIGIDVLVTADKTQSSISKNPQVIFTGNEYGVTWQDDRNGCWEIYFCRLSKEGAKIGREERITNKGKSQKASVFPSIVHTGSDFGLIWQDYRNYKEESTCDIYFMRLNSAGQRLIEGGDVKLSSATPLNDNPTFLYDKSSREFAYCWQSASGTTKKINFARFENNGKVIDTQPLVIAESYQETFYPCLAHSGTDYAIAWHDTINQVHKVFFKRLTKKDSNELSLLSLVPGESGNYSAYGHKIKRLVKNEEPDKSEEITESQPENVPTPSPTPKPAPTPKRSVAKVYTASKTDKLEGQKELVISENAGGSTYTSLVWTGREYGLAWMDNLDGYVKIRFVKIPPTGTLPTQKDEVSIAPSNTAKLNDKEINKPSLAWSESKNLYFIAWCDNREGTNRVFLSKIESKN